MEDRGDCQNVFNLIIFLTKSFLVVSHDGWPFFLNVMTTRLEIVVQHRELIFTQRRCPQFLQSWVPRCCLIIAGLTRIVGSAQTVCSLILGTKNIGYSDVVFTHNHT